MGRGGGRSRPAQGNPQHSQQPSVKPNGKPRNYTVSLAVPGSIVSNAQSAELRTYLVGQVARAAAVFNVDEVVVFSETGKRSDIEGRFEGAGKVGARGDGNPDVFMARVLEYVETPQYLRKALFPVHKDLRYAGLLAAMGAPHHMRGDADSKYREGVVTDRAPKPGRGSWVNCGLLRGAVSISHVLPAGTRVTVRVDDPAGSAQRRFITGEAVSPDTPRREDGFYWGYRVRLAAGLGEVLSGCPFGPAGYDLTVGVSGDAPDDAQAEGFSLPPFRHLLVVFGGTAGLQECITGDEGLRAANASELFMRNVRVASGDGAGGLRTEEEIQIALSVLRPHVLANRTPV